MTESFKKLLGDILKLSPSEVIELQEHLTSKKSQIYDEHDKECKLEDVSNNAKRMIDILSQYGGSWKLVYNIPNYYYIIKTNKKIKEKFTDTDILELLKEFKTYDSLESIFSYDNKFNINIVSTDKSNSILRYVVTNKSTKLYYDIYLRLYTVELL